MQKFIRRKETISSKIQGEIVMVDVDSGNYFSLNEVGTFIWESLFEPKTLEEICNLLLIEYDIDEATCHTETREFIEELLKLKLIETVNE